jgi:hypothetical protein
LGGKVIDLVRVVFLKNVDQGNLVGQVAGGQRNLILNMGNTVEINSAAAAYHADNVVTLLQQKFSQV